MHVNSSWKNFSMRSIDINCDMGEGVGNDEEVMPFISSANIACGYHAGNKQTMRRTIALALKYNVATGAHPAFPDKENFGRLEMNLSSREIYVLITSQLEIIHHIARRNGGRLQHVKPHGALYNISAKEPAVAKAIAEAVKDFDSSLTLFGLSGSHSIKEAKSIDLKTASEVFADRTYQDDGSLTPRSQQNALIEDPKSSVRQVLQMINDKMVISVTGQEISIDADTICIHGDGKNPILLAKAIQEALAKEGIAVRSC